MNKERIKLLIDALRSEKYKQTQYLLRKDGAYCCLGVACEIYREEEREGEWKSGHTVYTFNGAMSYPPTEVIDWFGINEGPASYLRLAELNDSGRSFADIAQFLEEKINE